MLYRIKISSLGRKVIILFTSTLVGLAPAVYALSPQPPQLNNSAPTLPPLILSGKQSTRPPGTYSPGVTEIIKMLDAKVDPQVVSAYVQHSSVAYTPDATEIVALKEHGASTEFVTALLQHGDEMRLRLAQMFAAQNPTPRPTTAAYDTVPEPVVPTYPDPRAYAQETSYPAPYYGYYPYTWPSVYWSSLGNNRCRSYGYSQLGDRHQKALGGFACQNDWANGASAPHQFARALPSPFPQRSGFTAQHTGLTAANPVGFRSAAHAGVRQASRSR
jgi:hypothetical protein